MEPPELNYKRKTIQKEEAAVLQVSAFKALPSTSAEMPPSWVAPRPPLWLADSALFYESVEDHPADLSDPPPNGGAWWLGTPSSSVVSLISRRIQSGFISSLIYVVNLSM